MFSIFTSQKAACLFYPGRTTCMNLQHVHVMYRAYFFQVSRDKGEPGLELGRYNRGPRNFTSGALHMFFLLRGTRRTHTTYSHHTHMHAWAPRHTRELIRDSTTFGARIHVVLINAHTCLYPSYVGAAKIHVLVAQPGAHGLASRVKTVQVVSDRSGSLRI